MKEIKSSPRTLKLFAIFFFFGLFFGSIYLQVEVRGIQLSDDSVIIYEIGGNALSLDATPSGSNFVVGSQDDNIYTFSTASTTPQSKINLGNDVRAVAISTDPLYFAGGTFSPNNTIYYYLAFSTLKWSYQAGDYITSLAISANGSYIAGGSGDNSLYLFNSTDLIWSNNTGSSVLSVAMSSNGDYIVAGNYQSAYLFHRTSPIALWKNTSGTFFYSVDISSDGQYIVAGCDNNKLYLFDKSSPQPLWTYSTGGSVDEVRISSNGQYIVAKSGDNNIYFFTRSNANPLWTYTVESAAPSDSLDISSDGEYITIADYQNGLGYVSLFNKAENVPIWSYEIQNIRPVCISENGQYILVGTNDDTIYVIPSSYTPPVDEPSISGYFGLIMVLILSVVIYIIQERKKINF